MPISPCAPTRLLTLLFINKQKPIQDAHLMDSEIIIRQASFRDVQWKCRNTVLTAIPFILQLVLKALQSINKANRNQKVVYCNRQKSLLFQLLPAKWIICFQISQKSTTDARLLQCSLNYLYFFIYFLLFFIGTLLFSLR